MDIDPKKITHLRVVIDNHDLQWRRYWRVNTPLWVLKSRPAEYTEVSTASQPRYQDLSLAGSLDHPL